MYLRNMDCSRYIIAYTLHEVITRMMMMMMMMRMIIIIIIRHYMCQIL